MIDAKTVLEKSLKVTNDGWDAKYEIREDNLYDVTHGAFVCRLDALHKVYIDYDELILDFSDDKPVILTPRGYVIGEEGAPDVREFQTV